MSNKIAKIKWWWMDNGDSFSPSDISNLVTWYDANDLSTITKDVSDLVSQFNDKTGNGHNLLQAAGANQPSWVDAQLNGKPVIRCGTNDFMLSAARVLDLQGIQKCSICAVGKTTKIGHGHDALNDSAIILSLTDNNTYGLFRNGTSTNGNLVSGATDYIKIIVLFDGAETGNNRVKVSYNGGAVSLFTAYSGSQPALTESSSLAKSRLHTGSTSTSLGTNGDFCESMMYSKLLDQSEIDSINDYFNTKWGL